MKTINFEKYFLSQSWNIFSEEKINYFLNSSLCKKERDDRGDTVLGQNLFITKTVTIPKCFGQYLENCELPFYQSPTNRFFFNNFFFFFEVFH